MDLGSRLFVETGIGERHWASREGRATGVLTGPVMKDGVETLEDRR